MTTHHSHQGNVSKRFITRGALVALCLASAYGCAVSNAESDDGAAPSVDGAGNATVTGLGTITPTATITPVPVPTPILIYDDVIDLNPGANSRGVTDDATKSPYRVKVTDALGLTNGEIEVSIPAAFGQTNAAICASYKLDVTVEGFSPFTQSWFELGAQTLTGSVKTSGGEFPTTFCDVRAWVDVGSIYSQVRVFAKGERNVVLNGVPIVLKQNASVYVSGSTPIPDPGKLLHVTNVALNAAKTGATAKVKNDGPQTATGVRASMSGSYQYCPPAKPGQSNYCVISGHPCEGFFCPSDVNPAYNQFWPHRAPITCTIENNENGATQTIGAGATVSYSWPSSLVSSNPSCPPCNPNDGRCANISLSVTTDSIDENDPWDTWDKALGGVYVSGVNN